MYDIEVSNFNNNSGLYAIALVAKWALEKSNLTNMPTFIKQITTNELAPQESPTDTQSALGEVLRANLAEILEADTTYKNSCFQDFVRLCLNVHKKLPDNMEAFSRSNAEFIFRTNLNIQDIHKGKIFTLKGVRLEAEHYAYIEVYTKWDEIYRNYIDYIIKNYVALSVKELTCLATHWGLHLRIINVGKQATELLLENYDFAIENKTGKQWHIIANDSTLQPASSKEDDQFKTLCIMDEFLRETLQSYQSSLDPTESSNVTAFRTYYRTALTKNNELVLVPINRRASLSFNGVVDNKEFMAMNSLRPSLHETLWSFKHPQKVYTTRAAHGLGMGMGAAFLIDGASIVAGAVGAQEAIFFSRAFQIGNAIRLGEAANIGEAILSVTNIAILASVISLELAMLARRKYNEFNDAIKEALELYQEELLGESDNAEKLTKVDQILRAELGIGDNNRWKVSRSVIWMQAKASEKVWKNSGDTYGLMYFILADIGPRLNKNDVTEFLEYAHASNDKKIKALSLFEITKVLLKKYEENPEKYNLEETNAKVRDSMLSIKTLLPELLVGCFNDVHNALAYTLWTLKTQNAKTSLNNIEKILQNTNLPLLSHMEPHGQLCKAVLLFIQGICLELQFKIAAEEHQNVDILESFRKQPSNKFKACCTVMLDIEKIQDKNPADSRREIAFLAQMRGYCKRFFEAACEHKDMPEDIKALISKYNLEEQVDSCDSDAEFEDLRQQTARIALQL